MVMKRSLMVRLRLIANPVISIGEEDYEVIFHLRSDYKVNNHEPLNSYIQIIQFSYTYKVTVAYD